MKKSRLLVSNYVALGISLAVLAAILVMLIRVFEYGESLFFAVWILVFTFSFPVIPVFAVAGAILYLVLLILNIRATAQSREDVLDSKESRRVWITFFGTTAAVILIIITCALIALPILMSMR